MKSDVRLKYGQIKMNNWYEIMINFNEHGIKSLEEFKKLR